jgi:tetratricopeptide (TPR) repeat protein
MKAFLIWWKSNATFWLWVIAIVFAAGYWCRFMAHGDSEKLGLMLALVASSFAIGTIFGFLFSSYGEEQSTIGKIRDWLIGGITGLGLAEAIEQGGSIKKVLQKFQFESGDKGFALDVGTAIAFITLGFFFMYFQRELIFNVSLAAKRAERGRIDGTQNAGIVIQRTLSILPASMLTGVDDIDEIAEVDPDETARLREILYSSEVEEFLQHASAAVRDGGPLDWDVISKVAYIQYYRTYFEKEKKPGQIKLALEWLLRALTVNPLHADLTVKYADILIGNKEYQEAAAILERLSFRPESPALVRQWLGYVLLFIPERIADAIQYSESFYREFPNQAGSLLNTACGYAQLYCQELKNGLAGDAKSKNKDQALLSLKKTLEAEPTYINSISSSLIQHGQDLACLREDKEFLAIIEKFKREASTASPVEQKA